MKPRRSPFPLLVAAAVLLLLSLYAAYTSQTAPDPDRWQTIAGVLGGAALMIVILSLVRRRR